MIKIATKIIMGKKLSDFSFGSGLYKEPIYVSVKVPVFSFEKLHDVDISLGPEMKSTGEVLGIAKTREEALFKGMVASGIKIPPKGSGILMTVRDSDKQELIEIAQRFERMGYVLFATGKTAHALNSMGVATSTVRRIDDNSPNIMDLISSGVIKLVINTPTRGRQPKRDGFKIRRKSIEMSIPCLTSLDTARALIHCIELGKKIGELEVNDLSIFE